MKSWARAGAGRGLDRLRRRRRAPVRDVAGDGVVNSTVSCVTMPIWPRSDARSDLRDVGAVHEDDSAVTS